jgi:tetratricopeptide (TPR) repeat protein
MAVRAYVAIAVLVTLAALLYAAERSGLVQAPWQPAAEAGAQRALVRPTWTLDLESGATGAPGADLHWGMQARDQPFLASYRAALIAPGGSARWEEMDEAYLSRLTYAPNQYSAWGPEAPARKGAVFAVRTVEGNFAKVRIVEIGRKYDLTLEWTLFAAATASPRAGDKSANASLAWLAARDEALAAYKAQRYQEALDACGKAVEAAQQAGAENHALALVSCGGLMSLHRRAARQMEDWLKQGVAITLKLDQRAIVAALGPREAMLKERALRMLGVFYRDQNRPRQAAENFALAVDTVRAMPPPETGEHRLALRSDLHDLGLVLAQMGLRGTARQALAEARELYLKTEPGHSALKAIETQLQRLEEPGK